MTAAADTSGQRCSRCAMLQRSVNVLEERDARQTAEIRRMREELAIESDVNVQGTRALLLLGLLVLGFGVVVAAFLWAIGRLAVAIGGA